MTETIAKQILELMQKFNYSEFRKDLRQVGYEINKDKLDDTFKDTCDSLAKNNILFDYENCFVLKSNNIHRRTIQFCVNNALLYLFLVLKIQDELQGNRIEGTFGGFRFDSIKVKKYDNEDDVEYGSINRQAWIEAYGEFNALCKESLNENEFVGTTDIANFYDNINLSLLKEQILSATNDKQKIINALFYFLEHWDVKTNGFRPKTVGIPQDTLGEASRLLANFYLQPLDEFIFEKCKKYKVKYIRYADDMRFFSEKKENIMKIIDLSSKYLSINLNLNLNSKKTFIFTKEKFNNKFYSIDFSEKNVKTLYLNITRYKKNEMFDSTIFNRAKKKLLNLVKKEKDFEDIIEMIKNIIDNDLIMHCKKKYEYKTLKNISEKSEEIKKHIYNTIECYIRNCYCEQSLKCIIDVFKEDLKDQASQKLNDIKNF